MAQATFEAPFIRDAVGTLQAAVVVRCSQAIERELPLLGEPSPIASRARAQQDVLLARLAACGVATTVLDAPESSPLAALCADTALVFPSGAFLMRPSDPSRRAEVAAIEPELTRLKVPIVGRIEAPGLFDGDDAMLLGEVLYLGVPAFRRSDVGIARIPRGNAHGRAQVAAYAVSAGLRVVEVPFSEEARRLRSVVSPIDAETVLYSPGLVDGTSAFAALERIEVPLGEDYGAGVLVIGKRRVLSNIRFRTVLSLLRKKKVGVEAIDLWEFGKLGATPSALVLALKRG
jgi:dimethylargininase